ncbi:MAG: hypothetical protein AAGA93_13200 [Actinomycetota bacterium]
MLITEIDVAWTYLAGAAGLVEAIEATDGIEARRAALDHRGTSDADRLNR